MLHRFRFILIVLSVLALAACGEKVVKRVSEPASSLQQLTVNADGSFSYTPPPGVASPVTFSYQVCLPAPNTTVCTTATVTLNVNAGTLVANDDDFRATPVDPALGGSTGSVLGASLNFLIFS